MRHYSILTLRGIPCPMHSLQGRLGRESLISQFDCPEPRGMSSQGRTALLAKGENPLRGQMIAAVLEARSQGRET
jgi:hypothetical protein